MAAALIVVDVQNDFLPGGALAVPKGDEVVSPVNLLMPSFSTVVLTADWHPADHSSFASQYAGKHPYETVERPYGTQVLWPDHCVAGSHGAGFAPDLFEDLAHAVIRKGTDWRCDSYSGFLAADRKTPTGLEGYLRSRGVTEVFVCGLALDFCVAWTALDAVAAGFKTTLVEDACRAIDVNGSLAAAMDSLRAAGVRLAQTAEVPALLRKSGH